MSQPEAVERATTWTGVHALAVSLGVSPLASAFLPRGLRLADPPGATLVVADLPRSAAGPAFHEVAVVFDVVDGRGRARHCPWSLVDDFAAVVVGAELLGVPRHMGRIAYARHGDRLEVSMSRSGVEVLRLDARLGDEDPTGHPAPVYGGRTIAQRETACGEPSLFDRRLLSETTRAARAAEVTLSVDVAADDAGALAALPAEVRCAGRFVTLDIEVASSAAAGAPQIAFTGFGASTLLTPIFNTLG